MLDILYSNYVILYGNYVVDNRWNIVFFLILMVFCGLLIYLKFMSFLFYLYNFILVSENNFRFDDIF